MQRPRKQLRYAMHFLNNNLIAPEVQPEKREHDSRKWIENAFPKQLFQNKRGTSMSRRRPRLRWVGSLAVVVVLALTSQRAEGLKAGLPSCPISLSASPNERRQPFGSGVVLFHPFLAGQVAVPRTARRVGPSNAWPMPRFLRDASCLCASRS